MEHSSLVCANTGHSLGTNLVLSVVLDFLLFGPFCRAGLELSFNKGRGDRFCPSSGGWEALRDIMGYFALLQDWPDTFQESEAIWKNNR